MRDLIPEPPSTYYYRQMFCCFFRDKHGISALDVVGRDNATFETDYPHVDSTFPHTKEVALDHVKGAGRGDRPQTDARKRDPDARPGPGQVGGAAVDLAYTEAEEEFRGRLREWLAGVLPGLPPKPSPDDWPARRAYDTTWQRMLYDAGYAGLHWPVDAGGQGATPTQHLIFLEETEKAGSPCTSGRTSSACCTPGRPSPPRAQPGSAPAGCPPVLRGDEIWCQGFSEPDAGSDLAALRTRAVRDGDDYVVTGQKTWTSHAEVADWCELLVRTDPDAPKHRGISWLAMPMDAPGITVRPLRTLAGSTEFAEVFLDEVRVPASCRVGAENDGWRVTMVTLSFERGTAFVGEVVACRRTPGRARRRGPGAPGAGTTRC